MMNKRKTMITVLFGVTTLSFLSLFCIGYILCKPAQTKIQLSSELPFDTISINSKSGSKIHGWKLNGLPDNGVVLLFHSLRSNRMLMVDRAGFLWKNGYTVLLFDFQAHGESKGKRITFGYKESGDVESIYDYAKAQYPHQKIGAIGISLGGAAILLRKEIKPLDAVILEAVYPTVEEATCDRLEIRLGFLAPVVTPVLLSQLSIQLGINKNDLKPIDHIRNQKCPIFIMAGQCDRHTKIGESKRLFSAAGEPKEFWEVPDAEHEDLHKKQPHAYEEKVVTFFGKYLRGENLSQ